MNLRSPWPADPRHRRLLGILTGIFVLAVALGLHGFSLPLFHEIIDGSPSTELVAGHYQWIRGDEWSMGVPLILSQRAHVPKFPVVNGNVGLGQNMLIYPQAPVADFFGLFRPGTWGFFVGSDFGLAWVWWFRVLGLFYAFFLLFMAVSENQFSLSVTSALVFLFAPFLQFWSLNSAEMLTAMAISVLLSLSLLTSPGARWLKIAALWWSGSCFALGFYPPFQVPLVYVALALVGTLTWLDYQKNGTPRDFKKRLGLLFGTALLIVATVAVFYARTKGPLEAMRNTAYPGLRHENGGGLSWVFFFSNFVDFFHHGGVYAVLGNICEAASFLFFFPLCAVALLSTIAYGRNPRLVALSPLAAGFVFLLFWMFVGLPDPLPAWTLMKLVPAHRTVIGVGVLNAVLIVAYLSGRFHGALPKWLERSLLAAWCGFLIYAGRALHFKIPVLPLYTVYLSVLVVSGVSALIFFRHRLASCALLLVSLVLTVSFNPVVRGGTRFLTENPLSKAMTAIGKKDFESRWVVFGSQQLGNLPRLLGLKSLSGLYFYPQLELWKRLDPDGREMNKYNRYLQTEWRVSSGPEVKFEITPPAILFISVDPKHPAFRQLAVNYFVVEGELPYFKENAASFELLFSHAGKYIYHYRGPG